MGTIANLQYNLTTLSLDQARASNDVAAQSQDIKESVLRLESLLNQEIQRMTSLVALNHENPLASFLSSSMKKTISSVVQNALKDLSIQTRSNHVPRCRKVRCRGRMTISGSVKPPVGEHVSWKSRVYRGFSCTASIIGHADESPTS